MKKNYLIFTIAAALVLSVGIFLQLKYDKVSKEMASINQDQNMQNNQNNNQPGELKTEIITEGLGPQAKNGDRVKVHYVGTFEDGTKFDSSRDRGEPFTFNLGAGEVILGWDLGVLGMKVGEIRKLTIPYNLGYGESGQGPIPPKATLIFEVELLGINE